MITHAFKQLTDYFYSGQNYYFTLTKKIHLTQTKIKNTKLAQELEAACEKEGGILTYSQYRAIEQFGKNGYYNNANADKQGMTNTHIRWGDGLAKLCQKYNCDTIIEFGCGTGELAVATVKSYKKQTNKKITWIGIEINETLYPKIKQKFTQEKIQESFGGIYQTLDPIKQKEKTLVVFPYSLDNLPPEIFLNTTNQKSFPNALLGIKVQNGILQESVIQETQLQRKKIEIKNGFFKNQNNQVWDLRTWQLYKGQRAYIPIETCSLLAKYTEIAKQPTLLIIDEFRPPPWNFERNTLGIPKSLYEKSQQCQNIKKYYQDSGEHNFYYPLYLNPISKLLNTLGFQSIKIDIEQKTTAELMQKKWFPIKQRYFTYAIIASKRNAQNHTILPISFWSKKII